MSAITEPVRFARAPHIVFELPDRSREIVPPPSADQGRRCLLLDPDPERPETPLEFHTRLIDQARILLGPAHAHLVEILSIEQIAEVVRSLYCMTAGIDPRDIQAMQAFLQHTRAKKTALELLETLDGLVNEIAAETENLPAEVGSQPLADLVSFREELRKRARRVAEWEARLHGKTIQG